MLGDILEKNEGGVSTSKHRPIFMQSTIQAAGCHVIGNIF